MKLSVHGYKRIRGRTKLLAKDVLSILSGGAAIELGSAKDCEFLLFYSPPDKHTKIAVVAKNRSILVSVWESTFLLPEGILKPNFRRREAAQKAFARFVIDNSIAKANKTLKEAC